MKEYPRDEAEEAKWKSGEALHSVLMDRTVIYPCLNETVQESIVEAALKVVWDAWTAGYERGQQDNELANIKAQEKQDGQV